FFCHCDGLGLEDLPPFAAHLAGLCARVIAVSDTVANCLLAIGVPRDRIITVLNAVDLDRVLSEAQSPPSEPLPNCPATPVLLVPAASIRPNKGIHVLLEAAREIPK